MSVLRYPESYKILKSISIFHISILYNSIKYGSSFTFNQIADDQFDQKSDILQIESDKNGNIIKLNDGKKTPLFIGSIIRKKDQLDKLRKIFTTNQDNKIGVYSLNLKFERDWSGLTYLLNNTNQIEFYKYPTVDFCSPSFIDILRIIRDINNRDSKNQILAYVHCKAGRGRSAVSIIAYLMFLLNNAGIKKDINQIEYYLKLKRFQIKLNSEHKIGLQNFQSKLNDAGSLKILLQKYKNEIEYRDKEILNKNF